MCGEKNPQHCLREIRKKMLIMKWAAFISPQTYHIQDMIFVPKLPQMTPSFISAGKSNKLE